MTPGAGTDPSEAAAGPHSVDLTVEQLDFVRSVLQRHGVDAINGPVLFGSRVRGRARRYSDLDVGFSGRPLSARQLAMLSEAFEESDLPINVDVLNLTGADEALRAHALADAVSLDVAVGRPG